MAIKFKPRWVQVDDFKNYWGKDLREILTGSSDNNSNYPEVFLSQVEDLIISKTEMSSFRNFSWDHLTPYQIECLQKAILIQSLFVIKEGRLGIDSGYNKERGKIADYDYLSRISLANDALDLLQRCGLFNLVVRNRQRFIYGSDLAESLSRDSIDGGPATPVTKK